MSEKTPKQEAIEYLIRINKSGNNYSAHDAITHIMTILGVK